MAVLEQPLGTIRAAPRISWRLLAIGVVLALVVGVLASLGHDRTTFVVALALPITILLFRYPWTAVLLFLAIQPLIVVGADGVAGPENYLIGRLLVPMVLALALGYRMLGLSRSYFRLSVTDIAIAAFVLLAMANIQLLSGNPVRMSVAFYDHVFIPITLYWLVRVIEPREGELRWMLWLMIGVLALEFAVGMLSWAAPSVLPREWLGRAGERTVGTVGGPAPYSSTLMVGAMLAVAFLDTRRSELARIALFGVVAIAFIGIAISFSRGSWAGAAVVLVGLLFLRRPLAIRLAAVLLVLVAGVAVVNGSALSSYVGTRLSDDDTAESRLVTNNAAIRMIQTRPLFGYGYGNFELYDEALKVRVGDMPAQEGSSHHTFLHLAAENGLPALALYLVPAAWLLLLTLRRWRQVTSRDPLHGPLLIAMWLALLHQFVVMNFMDMMDSSPWGTALWWLCLGVIHVVLTRGSRPPEVVRLGWTVPANLRQ
ncbi:MAG TPA: O-antigen ligase family protein [Candidatus Limnocylindria bacterium]|jgi:O-antigen ligase